MLQNNRENLELDKLQGEIRKSTAETRKLMAEAEKLKIEAYWYPFITSIAVLTGVAALLRP